ncbi:protein pxr1-like [Limosa lapponica baueri]|uniref:Protein pxr1-like n=1 Tax=Limosa lapponica baueri TaxID=1758121 RepID=A0A2I0TYW8_LIMLA|nr:protein pxr1-like [Limosa lapponica baueri]
MPAGSKMDPLLAKAEPISDSGSASVITYLRREKAAAQQQLQLKRGVRICERNNSTDIKSVVKTMVRQAMPLQPMKVNNGADIHLQPVEGPTLEQLILARISLHFGKEDKPMMVKATYPEEQKTCKHGCIEFIFI